jgi:nucleoside-diphosphate-sugar epimerase
MRSLMLAFRPDVVFHAAALKHVPYLERDWAEGVRTNVFGSINVADAAIAAGARTCVIISTDKAIEPVSMLGATKRLAEMYAQVRDADLAGEPESTRLIAVRFGNVLGSVGSVVPKFKAQIARGGPVTVTHPDMVRYFMTVREAADLVLTAASHAEGEGRRSVEERAAVYVLKMGQPVRIYELAERMIRLAGFRPGEDIDIEVTGTRPGERQAGQRRSRLLAWRPSQASEGAGIGDEGAGEALERALAPRQAGRRAQQGRRHRHQAGPPGQTLPQGGDHVGHGEGVRVAHDERAPQRARRIEDGADRLDQVLDREEGAPPGQGREGQRPGRAGQPQERRHVAADPGSEHQHRP